MLWTCWAVFKLVFPAASSYEIIHIGYCPKIIIYDLGCLLSCDGLWPCINDDSFLMHLIFPVLYFFWCIFFNIRFVKGNKPGRQTGFDIDEADLTELEQSHEVIVASAIFGTVEYKTSVEFSIYFIAVTHVFCSL